MIASWHYYNRVRDVAIKIQACEFAAFVIENRGAKIHLENDIYFRPNLRDQTVKAASLTAFREIALPCIINGRDGVIRVGDDHDVCLPQYCLVHIAKDYSRVATFITSRTSEENAFAAHREVVSADLFS